MRATMPTPASTEPTLPIESRRQAAARAARVVLLAVLALGTAAGGAQPTAATAGASLRERFAALDRQSQPNPFQAPVYLQATEAQDRVQGDVYALVNLPFREARPALERIEDWCRILSLHLNVKYCRPSDGAGSNTLTIGVGPKYERSLSSVNWVRFAVQTASSGDEHLQIVLRAPSGPFNTRDYRMSVEMVPFEGRSLLHLSYGYSYGLAASLAMQTYLATTGRDKVGFTVVGRQADGQPIYVDGLRGVIERNVMRYYFAFDAYLGAQRRPPQDRLLKSLQDWFDATERHPRQLREVSRSEYLDMKLQEFERQRAALTPQ